MRFNRGHRWNEVELYSESSDGWVALSAVGMDEFTARIRPGTVRELRGREFTTRAAEAVTRLLENYEATMTELKMRYYG